MEFFEKAHVAKRSNSSRKEGKSQENVKKKLKKMLYGYRHSDNELIKVSADLVNDFDESSSVSGYSDLNLTNSSFDGDKSQETVSMDNSQVSISDDNDICMDNSKDISKDNADTDSLSVESISEYDEDISLSEDISPKKLEPTYSDHTEDESASSDFIETVTDVDSNSNDDIDSDDLSLAEPIFQETVCSKKQKIGKKPKLRTEKQKISNIDNIGNYKGPYRPQDTTDDETDPVVIDLSTDLSNVSLPDRKQYKGPFRPTSDESGEILSDNIPSPCSVESADQLAQFVSVTATDMESQSLGDILGIYRHPTVRNLPTDSQNVFADNSGLFETENASVIDIQTSEDLTRQDDEINSLIPEIDNDLSIEDIEIDNAELDLSTEPLEDSTEYDKTEETSQIESDTDSYNPTLNIPVNVYYGRNNTCIFVLKHPTELYIHGKVKLECLGGTVEILGYTLQDKKYDIYAPNYNYAQCLKTVENQNAYYGLFSKLTPYLTVAEAEDIVTSIGEFDGVIIMEPLKSRQMEFVENNITGADLFNKLTKNVDNSLRKASEVLRCSLYLSKPWKNFEENVSWKQAITCGMNKNSRGIVCGGKGTGKSTFLRYYLNKVLAYGPVLVVDLDPGQCEFTVAGNISATVVTEPLLGPNFTHLRTPELTLNIGMINTMDNPRRYANAVKALITHCSSDERLKDLPWIVNTMGMTNTMGLKFMVLIILLTKPSFLLQINSKNVKKRFDYHFYPQTVKNLYFEDYQNDGLFSSIKDVNVDYTFILSQHTENTSKNYSLAPREERYLNFLAYFGQMLNSKNEDFLAIVPYEVNLKDLNIALNVKIDENAVTKVINGKVVALCQQDCHAGSGSVFTLTDTPLRCLGAGLVRGVDWEKGVLYIVSPVSGARLGQATALVYCDWAAELRGPGAAPPAGAPLPYRTASQYNQRRFMFAPRRRFNPLQLIKISRAA